MPTTIPPEPMRRLYEARAAQQYAITVGLPNPRLDRKFGRICEVVRAQLPRQRFLDAGCGDGRYFAAVAAMEGAPQRMAGIDISERILETARATAARIGCEPDLRRGSLEQLPFPDDDFDLVLCSQVIEHVLDCGTALQELARVLTPGGVLVLSTDNARNAVSRALNAPRQAVVRMLGLRGSRGRIESPATPFAANELRELIRKAGLYVEHVETFRFHLMWPLNPPLAQRLLNRLDQLLPPHNLGDILLIVARKPRDRGERQRAAGSSASQGVR